MNELERRLSKLMLGQGGLQPTEFLEELLHAAAAIGAEIEREECARAVYDPDESYVNLDRPTLGWAADRIRTRGGK